MTPAPVMLVNGSLFGGGAERVIVTLARYLRERGHRVTVAVVHDGGELLNELRQEGFDVVTTSHARTSTTSALHEAIASRGVQVVHSHDVRSLIDAGLCRIRSRRFLHVHTFHFGNYPHLPWKQLLMERLAARLPDTLVAVGNVQRTTIMKTLGLGPRRIQTVWNGVDYEAAPDWTGIDRSSPVLRIGSVSTFGEQKGLPTLLDAAKALAERGLAFRLVLVGEGPLRRQLEARADALGIADRVEFTGWRPDAARTLLPTFDIFVQSSYWEAMSIVILEAMAARLPIVATEVGENGAVLANDQSALLVPARDTVALADALARALQDAPLRQRLADAASASYQASFTGRAMADRHGELYGRGVAARGLNVTGH